MIPFRPNDKPLLPRRRVSISAAVLLAVFSAGCGPHRSPDASPRAEAVSSHRYPAERYLVGMGEGSDRQTAENNARAEIAKIFRVRIDSTTLIRDSHSQTMVNRRLEERRDTELHQVTSTETGILLTGVIIAESRLDASSAPPLWRAMAVLDLARARAALSEKILEADQRIRMLKQAAKDADDPLDAIRNLKQAVTAATEREALNEELQIISTAGTGIPAGIPLPVLKQTLGKVVSTHLPIGLEVEGSYQAAIRQALCDGVTRHGFTVAAGAPSQARILVQASFSLTPIDIPSDTWRFVRWSASCTLKDQRTGHIIGSITIGEKCGHLTRSAACQSAVRTASEQLASEISRQLSDFILGR